ncbi:hypothetical protein [Shouchella lonarensis]|uniref:Uncharacterized protein n=1 Tax=Shouchella lonarensis TaxID=1464122 RepID=A0A1G6HN25_9BACI|nr:hypothetical protein [Shouchella lonarensis]SDB95631.1 hypothetical protein SAMN05421737_10487 [Shouchella lonarensis]
MAIFKFLFGKPIVDHKVYTFIYIMLFIIYVGLGALFVAAGFPWHFILTWALVFPIFIRIEHVIAKMVYRGWVNASKSRFNLKTVGGVFGAMFLNMVVLVPLILYASYYSPNGYFVLNMKQTQVGNNFELSVGMLRGEYNSDFYLGVPVDDPNAVMQAGYEVQIGEGTVIAELYSKKSGDVVWSKEITYSVRGTIEIPAVKGEYYFRLIAEEPVKDLKFRLRT